MRRIAAVVSVVVVMVWVARPAAAATRTWDGGAEPNLNWSNAENWDAGIAAGDDLAFPPGLTVTKKATVFDFALAELKSLTFAESGYSVTGGAAGNVLGVASGGIDADPGSPSTLTLTGLTVRVDADQTWLASAGGSIDTGPINVQDHVLTARTAGNGRFTLGAVSGSGDLVKGGSAAGVLVLTAPASNFTGEARAPSGTLRPAVSDAFGTALVRAGENGGVELAAGDLSIPNFLTLNGQGPSALGALRGTSGTDTWSGAITLASTSGVGAAQGARLNVTGSIAGSGGLSKLDAGTVALSGDNIYSGPTTLVAGTLVVNGDNSSSAMAVEGGTLQGFGLTGDLTADGGTIAPGESVGILGTGSIALLAGSAYAPELNGPTAGTGHDQIEVVGTVRIDGGTLTPSVGGSVGGNSYTIIANDGADSVVGTFQGLVEGATITVGGRPMEISYAGGDGNDVVLTDGGPAAGTPPVFTADSPCGQTVQAPIVFTFFGQQPTRVVAQAGDSAGQTVTMAATGLPTWITAQPENGNPAKLTLFIAPGLLELLAQLFGGSTGPATVTITATDNQTPPASATCVVKAQISGLPGLPMP